MRERRHDTDAMGIVHQASYALYVELARVQCRERHGLLPRPAVP